MEDALIKVVVVVVCCGFCNNQNRYRLFVERTKKRLNQIVDVIEAVNTQCCGRQFLLTLSYCMCMFSVTLANTVHVTYGMHLSNQCTLGLLGVPIMLGLSKL